MITTVALTNLSSAFNETQVEEMARSLSIQGTHHIARAWGLEAISVQPRVRRADDWEMIIMADSDMEGALGYHDYTLDGKPVLKAFVNDSARAGVKVSEVLSHELAEAMVDPDIIRCSEDSAHNRIWAMEVADPTQSFHYDVAGWSMQDFVTPHWFNPKPPSGARLSWLNKVSKPFEVPSGGYAQYIDLSNPSSGWHQVGLDLFEGDKPPAPQPRQRG